MSDKRSQLKSSSLRIKIQGKKENAEDKQSEKSNNIPESILKLLKDE